MEMRRNELRDADRPLKTSELARAAGVGVETVRYYLRRGLLAEPPRAPSGYRRFPPDAVRRIAFVRRTQALGFTLDEIRELLELRVERPHACEAVEERAKARIAAVEEKLDELQRMKRALARVVAACEARERTGHCPLLEEIAPGS